MSGHSGTFVLKVKLRNKFQNNNTKIFLTPYSKFIDPLFLQNTITLMTLFMNLLAFYRAE